MLPFRDPLRPAVVFLACPVRASLDVLGRKWTLLILYSMGFMALNRFNELLVYMPEITRSTLAKRLSQLERSGYVRRVTLRSSPRKVFWELTQKGKDIIPIIMRLIAHSSKWRADELFEDRSPKSIDQIFPVESAGRYFEISR